MPLIGFRTFQGEVPQLPPELLPEGKAAYAEFCDFSHGDLSPLRDGLLYKTFAAPVKAMYTEDGINFFTWPIETFAYKSPVVDDTYTRVYYTSTTSPGLFVTSYSTATPAGGPPATAFKAGVPFPTAAPGLTPIELNTLRDYPSVSYSFRTWWAVNGVAYGATTPFFTETTPHRVFSVTVPAVPSGTPDGAQPVVEITLTDVTTGDVIYTMAKDLSVSVLTQTDALPGGLEMQVTFAGSTGGGTATVTLRYGVMETRAYTYTVVNQYAEESGPAPAATINVTYMQDVTIVGVIPDMTGYQAATNLQVYRTIGASANFLKIPTTVTGSSGSTITMRDSTWKGSDADDLLYTTLFQPPPDGLINLAYIGNGFFGASKNNTVYFCEPYRPHSWQYNVSFPHNVTGIQPVPSGCLVCTKGGSYLVQGAHPSAMVQNRIPVPQAGISQRSMTQVGGVAVYASNDGIVTSDGTQATLDISQQLWTREDWRDAYGDVLDDMIFGYHDGFLVGISTTANKGFLVKLDEQPGTLTEFPQRVDALFYLTVQDTLYYAVGVNVYRFRTSSTLLTAKWTSKNFVLPKASSVACGFLNAPAAIGLRIWADEQLVFDDTVDPGYFRLPAVGRFLRWQFEFTTNVTVKEISFAGSFEELKNA